MYKLALKGRVKFLIFILLQHDFVHSFIEGVKFVISQIFIKAFLSLSKLAELN